MNNLRRNFWNIFAVITLLIALLGMSIGTYGYLQVPNAIAQGLSRLNSLYVTNDVTVGGEITGDFVLGHYLDQSEPFNSKGNSFGTVQAAIDDLAGDGWVFVPEGTWSEALIIDENNVTLFGAGWSSIIDGGTSGDAINVTGINCILRDLQAKTTAGGETAADAIDFNSAKGRIINVYVSQADNMGIRCSDPDITIIDCYLGTVDGQGIYVNNAGVLILGTTLKSIGAIGIQTTGLADNLRVIGNFLDTTGDDGILIHADAENCVVDGNRITNWTNEAIDDDSGTSTLGDNDET